MDSALGRSPAEIFIRMKRRLSRAGGVGAAVGAGVGCWAEVEAAVTRQARRSDVTWMRRFIGELLVLTCARTRGGDGPFPRFRAGGPERSSIRRATLRSGRSARRAGRAPRRRSGRRRRGPRGWPRSSTGPRGRLRRAASAEGGPGPAPARGRRCPPPRSTAGDATGRGAEDPTVLAPRASRMPSSDRRRATANAVTLAIPLAASSRASEPKSASSVRLKRRAARDSATI